MIPIGVEVFVKDHVITQYSMVINPKPYSMVEIINVIKYVSWFE